MLDQNFQTNEDQNNTTGDLSIFSEFSTDFISKENRDAADDKCGDANKTDSGNDVYFQECKTDTDCESIKLVATASSRISFAGIEST